MENNNLTDFERYLNVCRKLWAVSPKSFFSHLPRGLKRHDQLLSTLNEPYPLCAFYLIELCQSGDP